MNTIRQATALDAGRSKTSASQLLYAPISWGELIDKITILNIKANKISNIKKLENINNELYELETIYNKNIIIEKAKNMKEKYEEILNINNILWDIENQIRKYESDGDFGPNFVEAARSVYKYNDKRAEIKREINLFLGSAIVEEKQYHHTRASK